MIAIRRGTTPQAEIDLDHFGMAGLHRAAQGLLGHLGRTELRASSVTWGAQSGAGGGA